MRAVILAAGMGQRLGLSEPLPKILLRFGGETLLARHLRILAHCGVEQVDMCIGFRADALEAELARLGATGRVDTRYNPQYERGSVLSLWTLREAFASGETVIFMDGDMLYDHRMMKRLIAPGPPSCFLMDRNLDPGEDPVKICMRDGRLVDFHKRPKSAYDPSGEWIGFARFAPEAAAEIASAAQAFVDEGRVDLMYEEVFRSVLLSAPEGAFGVEDVTGLPWVEIDFPEDLEKAEREIFPSLEPLPE